MKVRYIKFLVIAILYALFILFLSGCESFVNRKPSCPMGEVEVWLDKSGAVAQEGADANGMFYSARTDSDFQSAVRKMESVYRHQVQIEAPECLAKLNELTENQYYWEWKYLEATMNDDFELAEEYYRKGTTAMEEGDRELDRVAREQGW